MYEHVQHYCTALDHKETPCRMCRALVRALHVTQCGRRQHSGLRGALCTAPTLQTPLYVPGSREQDDLLALNKLQKNSDSFNEVTTVSSPF